MKNYLIKHAILFLVVLALAIGFSIYIIGYNLDVAGWSLLIVLNACASAFFVWLVIATYKFFSGKSART